MSTLTASKARQELYRLVDKVAESHRPILITGKRNNAVLISEEDFRNLEESLHLASIPGMVASIKDGMNTDAKEMEDTLKW